MGLGFVGGRDRSRTCVDRSCHVLQRPAKGRRELFAHLQSSAVLAQDVHLRQPRLEFRCGAQAHALTKIERIVNGKIMECLPVTSDVMDIEEAKKSGAIALFDEKYTDRVRVVRMGDYSAEFCGGTHLSNTGRIGSFIIQLGQQ